MTGNSMETRTGDDGQAVADSVGEDAGSVAHSANHLTCATGRALLEAFVQFFETCDRSSVVLEMGCGDGFWLETLRNLGYRNVVGIDASRPTLEVAAQKGLNVRLGDLYNLEVDDVFDIVVFCDTLEHLPDPKTALRRAHRALRTRGTLFLAVPVYDSVAEQLERRLRGVTRPLQCRQDDATHLHAFTEAALHALLDECHFSVDRSYRVGNLIPGKDGRMTRWTGNGRFGRWLCVVAQSRFYVDFGDESEEQVAPAVTEEPVVADSASSSEPSDAPKTAPAESLDLEDAESAPSTVPKPSRRPASDDDPDATVLDAPIKG
jgi:SAM-dependent methyltransferase